MKIIKSPKEMQKIAISLIKSNKSLGFVPTMGAIHNGHLSLIKESLKENNISTVSIFVNPSQFSANEDFNKYPKPIDSDINKLKTLNIDYLFMPNAEDIYKEDHLSYVSIENLSNKLCGISRPSHFRGVLTICTKLFNIIMPTIAYFGQKDYQQSLIIKQLIKDLNIPIKLKILPTIREKDGLAISSRNTYLNTKERKQASAVYKSLKLAENIIKHNQKKSDIIKNSIINYLNNKNIAIDYVSICDPNSLNELAIINLNTILIAIAVYISNIRLIDNMLISLSD